MNANQLNFHGIADGHGGVKMVPRKNSPVDRALRRLYGVSFTDQPIPLTSATPPMNNLGRNIPAPKLDPDLHQMMGNTPSQDRRRRIFAAQRQRDARRGFDATGNACDCTRDQGPSPTKAVQSVTRGINRVSELGEEVNRDQLPDDEHEEPDGDETVQVIGTLEPPPDGYTYNAYKEDDGSVTVVLEPDTGDPPTTHDRMYRHRISDGVDPVLRRMNKINRAYHVRDADTVSNTLLRHRPGPGCRLELHEDGNGFWSVLLISPVPGDDMFENPQGSQEDFDESDQSDDPAEAWVSGTAGKPGEHELPTPNADRARFRDRRIPEAVTIRAMNQSAKAFWQRR